MARMEEFVENLALSGLVEPPDVERARLRLGRGQADDPAKLARMLIQLGILTTYQARKVLSGATRGFFLGGYRILRPLGAGGMGKVYLASSPEGRRVAVKVLPPRKAAEEEQALLRFRREMELSRRVVHPNVARTVDVGRDGDVYFMVLEYIPGESLYDLVKGAGGGPLRVPDAARFFLKLLDGLEAAHRVGLVHRDIKPSNVMATPDGDAILLDLGLARDLAEVNRLTRHNVVIGTLDYASPEQLGNAARADARSDMYSVGCTLYFTLAGRPPFEGGDVVNKIFKQRMEDPEPLEQAARGVPAAFAAIVRKLMAKSPDDRYQAVPELRADLARWADPAVVRAILGAEAEAAHAFRPPPPVLDDADLLSMDEDGLSSAALRDLGDPEPSFAPMYRPPPPPRPALLVPEGESVDPPGEPPPGPAEDNRWLVVFVVVACLLGVAAIVLITLVR